ncbi:MAG: DNA polymerase III subunit beta, partial [Proteobacteria bacterium]|nr:DNA polymerase III subunit beta [Pseudomonadota bacterium]
IVAQKGKLTISGTDMMREASISLDAQVEKTGATTADARMLAQFVAGLADGLQVEASLAGERLTVRAGRARATFPTLSPEDLPTLRPEGDAVDLELEGAAFAAVLRSVAHAQSTEETRIYLNGVYLHRRADRELVAVATNGHCLARTVLSTSADLPDFAGVIVPREAVDELATLAAEAGTIELAIGTRLLCARAGDVVLTSKLIDGTFPDYEHVIPPATVKEGFDLAREDLILSLKRVGVFDETDRARSRPVKFSPHGKSIELMASSADLGEIADEIDAQATTKIPVGMNARYVLAALEALGGKTTQVRYADAGAPIAFTDPNAPNKLQIVMPRRI